MIPLEMADLNLGRFAALKGQRFDLLLEGGESLPAELVEARKLPGAPFQGREPFSLLFKGPPSPLLPQRIYRFAHAGEPEPLEIFIVPISADPSSVCYEAVFG